MSDAILGAHMSVAGGFYKAVDAARQAGCDCVQIFSKNNNQWRAKPILDEQVDLFRKALEDSGIRHTLVHASYLINLASPNDELWQKSIEAVVVELERADQLGIPHVVLHPGSFTTSTEAIGLRRISDGLKDVLQATDGSDVMCLLETTAGQGSNLGHRFEQLATLIDAVNCPERIGVCLDTCHIFAAGYALETRDEYQETMHRFDQLISMASLKAIHLNDSKQPFASRKDRHEHIGKGHLGLEPFRHLLNDPRLHSIPMYLETPKGDHEGETWDKINLATLRQLIEC